jgi:hypothetical protein
MGSVEAARTTGSAAEAAPSGAEGALVTTGTAGGPHFWVELRDENAVIDLPADRRFRVRAARRQPATAA